MDGGQHPPPPPPPHGEHYHNTSGASNGPGTKPRGDGLPDGNYDIFIVPPHSSGGGFIYFPSLQPQRNSFIAGMVCAAVVYGIWSVVYPVMREWFFMIVASGGAGVALLLVCVGGVAWAAGRVNMDSFASAASSKGRASGGRGASGGGNSGGGSRDTAGTSSQESHGYNNTGSGFSSGPGNSHDAPPYGDPRQGGFYQQSSSGGSTYTNTHDPSEEKKRQWEKQREEIRKKNEQKKKEEEAKRRLDEYRKRKQEEAEAKKKQQEKEELEQQQQREKEERERVIKERRERLQKEREEREKRIREEKEKEAREQPGPGSTKSADSPSPKKSGNFRHATAHTDVDPDEVHSFRPYDKPKPKAPRTFYTTTSASSFAASSYAASDSTSRTTPPPVNREASWRSADPDAIVIKAAYAFNNLNGMQHIAEIVAGAGNVSTGLVLRITTEGMFIDDEGRGSPQREWDTKAWTLKHVETGEFRGVHLIRTNIRDVEGRRFVFVYTEQDKKAKDGLQRLKKSPNIRGLNVSMLEPKETKAILERTGWI